jgi:glycosyltransferase involved in cell wall biosynthesis
MSKRRFDQLVHTLSYGDAISGEVLAIRRCCQEQGFDADVFALNIHPFYKGLAHDISDFRSVDNQELILHYSLGSPLNRTYLEANSSVRSLIYHNLTPFKWFEGINPRIVKDIKNGLDELPRLCAASKRLIADSRFNIAELSSIGFPEALLLELPVDSQKWDVARNEGIYSLVKSEPGIHLLHVGRLAPNKCIEDIIKVFYYLHHYIERNSKLWLVGIDIDTELYSYSLKRLAHELKLEKAVSFVGCLADSEVKALYQATTAYLCMSEHEGYCLPLVEAMSFGLPVLAFDSSAISETLGKGGILFTQKRHHEIAELINKIYQDSQLRSSLSDAGRARVAGLSLAHFKAQMGSIFGF